MKKWIFCVLVIFIIVAISLFFFLFFPIKYNSIVLKYCETYNLDEVLVFGVIKAESGFNKKAKSKMGACGLMQVMPATADDVAKKIGLNLKQYDLFEPNDNINIGCYYLKYLMDMYDGNEVLALCAYNAGYNNVNAWLKNEFDGNPQNIPVKETKDYVRRVKNNKKIYKLLYH